MNTQEVLDPKSWAERTFGGVQLHDMRRTKRAVQAESRAGGEPLGFFASSNADLERE
jgi:Transposase DNA-binding